MRNEIFYRAGACTRPGRAPCWGGGSGASPREQLCGRRGTVLPVSCAAGRLVALNDQLCVFRVVCFAVGRGTVFKNRNTFWVRGCLSLSHPGVLRVGGSPGASQLRRVPGSELRFGSGTPHLLPGRGCSGSRFAFSSP